MILTSTVVVLVENPKGQSEKRTITPTVKPSAMVWGYFGAAGKKQPSIIKSK